MGQNFLVESSVVEHIVEFAGVRPLDLVVEIGPGMGILTRELIVRGATVRAIELDRDLAALLRDEFQRVSAFSVVEQDARFVDIAPLVGDLPYKVVANLPYSVATVIIRHFVESVHPPARLTVMVQREVAERMAASPPEMSLLGLATQFFNEIEPGFTVPADVFLPPPNVESAVINLVPRAQLALDVDDRSRMFELATMAFQRRRKTIANGLVQGLDRSRSDVEGFLVSADIDPMRRPQTLAVEEWIRLAQGIPR